MSPSFTYALRNYQSLHKQDTVIKTREINTTNCLVFQLLQRFKSKVDCEKRNIKNVAQLESNCFSVVSLQPESGMWASLFFNSTYKHFGSGGNFQW